MTEQVEQTGRELGERLFHEIKTLEQGQNYMLELTGHVEKARSDIDEMHILATKMSAVPVARETLEKAYRNLSVRYGRALGALTTLMHCRVLNDEVYSQLRARIDMAMLPKVTATIGDSG